ncbi:protein transport protein SEC13 [Nematocida sp. AWRm77]|nr:protein transport protein SEC13 [Nematocida sp. AWRm77]
MSMEHEGESVIYNLSTNEEGSLMVAACEDGRVKVFRVDEKGHALVQNLIHHKTAVFFAFFFLDHIVSSSYDGEVVFWKKTGENYAYESTVHVFQGAINSMAGDASSKTLYCGCSDGKVRKITCTGEVQEERMGHKHGTTGVSLFEEYLVSGGMDGTAKIWSKTKLESLSTLQHHTGPIRDCKACPNTYGSFVFATCSDDGSVIVYTQKREKAGAKEDAAPAGEGKDLVFHTSVLSVGEPCTKLSWSQSGYALSVGYGEGKVKVFLPSGGHKWKEASVLES